MLDLPARPDAPIACDLSGAPDTAEERLQAYRDLFAHSLLARERRPGATVLSFRADAQGAVQELARREAACCPFLSYRVEPAVVWTISGEVDEALDAFHAGRITLPE